MTVEEQRVVANGIKGIYQGMKTLQLNHSRLTDKGLEILSEALKHHH